MSHRERLISDLDASMDAVQRADDRHDEDAAWVAIQHVLTCLYRLEEQEKQAGDAAYYRHRDNSIDGRTVGGLSWIRGLLAHQDTEVRASMFRPFAITADDTALQPLAVRSGASGQLLLVDEVRWPERRRLPTPGRRYKAHQRDQYYEQLVADHPLMAPLLAARRYFVRGAAPMSRGRAGGLPADGAAPG